MGEPGTREGKKEQGRDTYVLFAIVFDDEEDEELLDVPVEGRGEVFERVEGREKRRNGKA